MISKSAIFATLALAGCTALVPVTQSPVALAPMSVTTDAVRMPVNFDAVVAALEPVAEQLCRDNAPGENCDFRIFVDARPGLLPNAYQRLDDQGRPEIGFTTALIAQAYNNDELAFILGHEAAHHISGDLARTQETALAGAVLGGLLATLAGADIANVELAQNLGGTVGARTYSKEIELAADRLGTVIAYRAGFDPLTGAQFFTRIPDPGNRFLGTHPPNATRLDAVRRTMEGLS